MAGIIPSTEFNAQIVRVVRQVLSEERGGIGAPRSPMESQIRVHYAITNAALAAASNALTTPSTGTVEILKMNHSTTPKSLERSGVTHTCTNRYENVAIVANTLVVIMRVNGEWILAGGDCNAMASPPA